MLSTFEVSYKDGVKHFLHTANSWDAAIDEKLEYVKGLAKQIDEKFIAPHNPRDGKLGVTLETERNGGFRLVAEWSYAPANAGSDHGSSQVQNNEVNTFLRSTNGRSEPPNTNSDDGRHATIARVPRVSVSAQTPIQRFLGSSGNSGAAQNASIRSRLRSARTPNPSPEHEDPVVMKTEPRARREVNYAEDDPQDDPADSEEDDDSEDDSEDDTDDEPDDDPQDESEDDIRLPPRKRRATETIRRTSVESALRRSNRLREHRMILQDYEAPEIFDQWLEDFIREIPNGFGNNIREAMFLDDDGFREVLHAILIEMESYGILYANTTRMGRSDLDYWKQTLSQAVLEAIKRLDTPTKRFMRNNPLGAAEVIMFDIGVRLNVIASSSEHYNLEGRMSRAGTR